MIFLPETRTGALIGLSSLAPMSIGFFAITSQFGPAAGIASLLLYGVGMPIPVMFGVALALYEAAPLPLLQTVLVNAPAAAVAAVTLRALLGTGPRGSRSGNRPA
ncbi:hypothetical protein [Histidinibacterium aquaticum]|uniref:Uncharacterized protein n=1 Tax=Histidinibacterium aquaticum TaxID=2613962 RepID=A0A5J5GCB3_9RHOB|nr:hypothetical protein [Histidinibacterium aquaticum]KAA9005610.1 hypothetical protein F3S47_17040 [Histidinibacterium aquaticum]